MKTSGKEEETAELSDGRDTLARQPLHTMTAHTVAEVTQRVV